MGQIDFITRFIAYLPDDSDRGREELRHAVDVGGSGDLGLELLRHDTYLLAVTAPPPRTGPADMLLDVFPGTAASARLAAASFDDAMTAEDIHCKAEASAQCYNLLQPTDTGFLLESDALGLKPVYIARTPGGHVLGSRIADLLHLFPALAEPTDTVALYELIGFWTPLMGRTLHQRIRRTLPGGSYRWVPATGLSARRVHDLRPTPVEPLRFMDQTIESIRDAAGQSLLDKTAGASPILLSLSGGFDSRLIAAMCRDHGIHVRALCYGHRLSEESVSARAAARALGIDLEMLPHRKDVTSRYLADDLETTEGTVDPAALSITTLFDAPSARGSAMLHGFCGDLQSGSHVSRYSAADYASIESVANAVSRRYYASTRPDLRQLFTPKVDLDEVRQDVLSGLRTDCPPYQAYLLWFLENRNRRYVGSQFPLLGKHFDTVLPFYDRRLFDIWHSIPPVGLADRTVLRKLYARYYPALARIPHPEESAPITPNLRWQIGRFYRRLPARALGLRTEATRAYMLSEIAALQPALKEALGVELSPQSKTILSADRQALRSMFLVANYARLRFSITKRASS